MDIIQYTLLAIGLSMDSLIIALTSGAILGNHLKINILKIAGMLAVMQTVLTVIGWFIGAAFVNHIDKYDHWIAFTILTFLGIKVIFDGLCDNKEKPPFNPLSKRVMFSLALATSIDALAVGLSLSLVNTPILKPAIIIAVVTFMVSALGIVFGSKAGKRYNLRLNLIGGIILIIIGSTILCQHTIYSI